MANTRGSGFRTGGCGVLGSDMCKSKEHQESPNV